jgi:hypothetical protein
VNIGEPNGVYFGLGDGTFEGAVSFGGSEDSYALEIADIDQDDDLDIVVANVNSSNSVYLNDNEGTQWTEVKLGDYAATTYGLDVGDLDQDGYPDLGFANSNSLNRLFYNRINR